MSIEKLIADQTAAIIAQTEAINRNSDLLEGLTASAKGASASSAAKTSDEAIEKVAAAKTATTEEPKKPATRSRAKAPAKPKAMTAAELATFAKGFIDVDSDDEYNARKALIKDLAEHYGVTKLSEVEEEQRADAKERIEAYLNGDDPFADLADESSKPSRRDDDDI